MEASHCLQATELREVECMNWTLKTTLAKLCQETQLSWVDILPLVLLQARCTPGSSGYSPFEILYGRTPPVILKLKGNPQQLTGLEMSRHLQALGKVFNHIARETLERTSIPLSNWVHPHQPGDEIWVKDWKKRTASASLDRPSHGRPGNPFCC